MDRIGLSELGRRAVDALRVARTRADLEAAGLDGALVDAMAEAGLLESAAVTKPPADYDAVYAGWKSQRGMLIDHARTHAYRDAIHAVVREGDTVVDVGTGSGALAMFAAQAGAGTSYGLEITDMARWAERLAEANGLDAVRIVKGDAGLFDPGGAADVIVSEYLGMTLFDEWRHYVAYVEVRDRLLREGGSVVPRAGAFLMSTVDSHKLYWERGYGFYERPSYGLDFSIVRESEIASPRRYIVSADYNSLVETRTVAEFDFLTSGRDAFFFEAETEFTYPAAGAFHGFLGHFDLEMSPGLMLRTGPRHGDTHWHHTYFPMPRRAVGAGETLRLRTRTFLDEEGDVLCMGLTVAGAGERMDAEPEHVFRLE